jgi:hypothetical protein
MAQNTISWGWWRQVNTPICFFRALESGFGEWMGLQLVDEHAYIVRLRGVIFGNPPDRPVQKITNGPSV